MKTIFKIATLFLLFVLVDFEPCYSQSTNLSFIEDTTMYSCKVLSIDRIGKSCFGIRIIVNINGNQIPHYIVTTKSKKTCPQGDRIRAGQEYKLFLSRYHETAYFQSHTKFINSILIGDKVLKILYDYSFPWVMVSPNLNGNRIIPIDTVIKNQNTVYNQSDNLERFLKKFIYNICVTHDRFQFYSMVDSVKLKSTIRADLTHEPFASHNFDLASFMFDSLFSSSCNQSNVDELAFGNDFDCSIVLYKDSIFNSRIKWSLPNDKYPQTAMVAVLFRKEAFSIIGFCKIPLTYTVEYSK